jgi:hypothetical protein
MPDSQPQIGLCCWRDGRVLLSGNCQTAWLRCCVDYLQPAGSASGGKVRVVVAEPDSQNVSTLAHQPDSGNPSFFVNRQRPGAKGA